MANEWVNRDVSVLLFTRVKLMLGCDAGLVVRWMLMIV